MGPTVLAAIDAWDPNGVALVAPAFPAAGRGVNVTIGLPVVRTSVDHGTAFDIAGTGAADERSLEEALRQAAQLSTRRA